MNIEKLNWEIMALGDIKDSDRLKLIFKDVCMTSISNFCSKFRMTGKNWHSPFSQDSKRANSFWLMCFKIRETLNTMPQKWNLMQSSNFMPRTVQQFLLVITQWRLSWKWSPSDVSVLSVYCSIKIFWHKCNRTS